MTYAIEWQDELENLLINVGVMIPHELVLRVVLCWLSAFALSFWTPAPLETPTETICSNGLLGVERNGICCEAECGTCGGAGCAGRPGGSVRWCLLVVLSLALCYHATLANDAVLFVPGLKKRGKCRRDPGPIDCLSFGSETCTTQPRNVGRFDKQWYSVRLVGRYGRRTLCARRTCISYREVFLSWGLGI